ncbi:GL15774, partial [Drosophila persimilis]
KLPMLKCPGNQVIFSKNKIGQSFKSAKQEFDASVTGAAIPEYNPLHDANLRTFYSNERNLKRLRENGEITQTNDVICNLKDFNHHRQELHKSQLYYVLQAYKRREAEQHDRLLIANAEAITKRDHLNLAGRHQCYEEVVARKMRLDMEKHERMGASVQPYDGEDETIGEPDLYADNAIGVIASC